MSIRFLLHRPSHSILIVTPLLVSIGGLLLAPLPAAATPPKYKLVDLGYLFNNANHSNDAAVGNAVNASGQVAGSSVYDAFADSHAFRTAAKSPINPSTDDLGDLGGFISAGHGINLSGQVVGASDNGGESHAFRTSANAPINPSTDDLGTLGGNESAGYSINSKGQVTGFAKIAVTGAAHAFRSSDNSGNALHDIGTLGGLQSFGYGINFSGQVAGYSNIAGLGNPSSHAFRTTANGNVSDLVGGVLSADLGTLPGGSSSFGRAINDSGQVVGYGNEADGKIHAFRTTATGTLSDGTATDLGTFGGDSQGFGIDTAGNVVGVSNGRAFLYTGSSLYDLNSYVANTSQLSGWTLTNAFGINDSGLITGLATDGASVTHAFLLEPDSVTTPEPGSVALLAACVSAGTCFLRCRRVRARFLQVLQRC